MKKTVPTQTLTDHMAQRAKPGDVVQDKAQPKLRLVVSPLGKAIWQYYGAVPGSKVPKRKTLGTVGGMTAKAARAVADEMAVALRKPDAQRDTGKAPTFKAMLDAYGNDWRRETFARYFGDWLMMPMNKVTREMAERRQAHIRASAAVTASARDERQGNAPRKDAGRSAADAAGKALRAVYNDARKAEKYMGANLGNAFERMPYNPSTKWMRDEEVRARFLDALDNWESHGLQPWCRPFFLLLFLTGTRKSPLLAARWADIDLKGKVWTTGAAQSKNRKNNHVYLGPKAVALLEELKAASNGSPWVFPSPLKNSKGHLADEGPGWVKLKEAAGLDGYTVHTLRKTFASMLLNRGTSIEVVSKAINHSDIGITQRAYGFLNQQTIHAALAEH